MKRWARLSLLALLAVVGCSHHVLVAAIQSPAPSPSLTVASPAPSPARHHTARKAAPQVSPRPIAVPAPVVRKPPAAPAAPLCAAAPSTSATQLILVRSSGTSAEVSACHRDGSRWVRDLGPYYGHVGYNGVTSPSAKREGDGHTPAGIYGMGYGFGIQPNPGLPMTWRSVHSGDVWVDDPRSSLYNTWQTNPSNGRWSSAESLNQPGPYDLSQVIDYNTARTPYKGSAIFLHVDTGGSTSGCVAMPKSALIAVFRWERAGTVISIS